MKYLMLKDFIIQKRQVAFVLLLLIVLTTVWYLNDTAIEFIYLFGSLIVSISLMTGSLSYDAENDVELFLLTLPIQRKTIVLSKYVVGFIMVLIGGGITFLQVELLNVIVDNPSSPPWTMIIGSFMGNLIITALIFATYYRFGYQNIKFVWVSAIVLAVFASVLYMQTDFARNLVDTVFSANFQLLAAVATLATILIYLGSLFISVRAIEKN